MDSSINPDLIVFASNLALAVNLIGGGVFVLVIRRLWVATERKLPAPRTVRAIAPARTAHPCPAL